MTRTKTVEPGWRVDSVAFLHGIWAAVPTPFEREANRVDLPGVRANARRFRNDIGLDGIFCNGLIGEQWSLTLDERKRILEASLDGAGTAMKVGVVVSAQCLADTLDLTRHASSAGAHHIVLMRPSGFTCSQEVDRYIRSVAACSRIPVVLFDGGSQTGGLSPDLISGLARDGVIRGVKCTRGGDSAEVLRAVCPESISIVDPYESHWLNNLVRFDLRVLYADPEPYLFQLPGRHPIADYFRAYAQGQFDRAVQIFRQLEPLRRLYHSRVMAPLVKGRPVNAVVKRWLDHLGFATGPVRAPLAPLSQDEALCFDRELKTAFRQVYGDDFTFQ